MPKLVIADPLKAVRFCEDHAAVAAEKFRGWTALHSAAEGGHLPAAELLIGKGLRVDARDQDGDTPLHMAAQEGHTDVVRLLLERGTDPDAANVHGGTPLHRAAAHGRTEIVRLLLGHGASKELLSKQGNSALEMAEAHGHFGVVELLRLSASQASPTPESNESTDVRVLRALATMANAVGSLTKPDEADAQVRTLIATFRQVGERSTVLEAIDRIERRGFPEPTFAYSIAVVSVRRFADTIWPASARETASRPSSRLDRQRGGARSWWQRLLGHRKE